MIDGIRRVRHAVGAVRNRRLLWALIALMICSAGSAFAEATALPDPLAAGWQGMKVCERLHEDATQRVLRCTFPPGVGHERHFHKAHFGYALAGGRMRMRDASGQREVSLKTGSHYTSDGTPWHEVVNIGETTVIYLIIEPKSR